MNQLTDRGVRILYIPPAAVASIHCVGGMPELETDRLAREFIEENRLDERKLLQLDLLVPIREKTGVL